MLKSLINDLARQKQSKARNAKSAQESIPIQQITADGMFRCGRLYSKSYEFSDVNYAVASPDEQQSMFLKYRQLLNGLPTECVTKITIMNSRQQDGGIRRDILMPDRNDGLDGFRGEYNRMIREKTRYGNGITQKRYVTVSTERKSEQEARQFFQRTGLELESNFKALGASLKELTITERLSIIGGFLNDGVAEVDLHNIKTIAARGHDFRDAIAPMRIKYNADHIEINDKYCRVLFLRDYPSYLKDALLNDLSTAVNMPVSLSLDILAIPTEEGIRDVESKLLSVDSDRTRFQQRQNKANNFSAIMPYQLQSAYDDTKELLDDLQANDLRLMFGVLTLAHFSDTKEQLDADTEILTSVAGKYLCTFKTLTYQQEDALNTALPYGVRTIEAVRSLTTESAAAIMPFNAQEMLQPGGVYYGVHAVTNNLLICDRAGGLNANGFILGTSGSGKSFAAKMEMVFNALSRVKDTVMVIDPQGEYSPLIEAMGGTVIHIATGGATFINALDMTDVQGEDADPIAVKSEFVMSLCEQILNGSLGAKEKSIIDRCVGLLYRHLEIPEPALPDFHKLLTEQPEPEAMSLATALELFTRGSLNMFAKKTNVDTSKRIISFSMKGMGNHIRPVAMLVVLDAINNRVSRNRAAGVRTHIYIDEYHLYFKYQYSAEFLLSCWKMLMNAPLTGITQNIEECLNSNQARTMLANSEFMLLLNQSATDRSALAELLKISDTQMAYVTDAQPGAGLLKYGSALVPFKNEFPQSTLYRLMSTKPADAYNE